jgi:hypothetical protein
MPDWIGDQMAGVGPEATRVFGRNVQTPVVHGRLGERVKSTRTACCPCSGYGSNAPESGPRRQGSHVPRATVPKMRRYE